MYLPSPVYDLGFPEEESSDVLSVDGPARPSSNPGEVGECAVGGTGIVCSEYNDGLPSGRGGTSSCGWVGSSAGMFVYNNCQKSTYWLWPSSVIACLLSLVTFSGADQVSIAVPYEPLALISIKRSDDRLLRHSK